jgi:hypothetical protein
LTGRELSVVELALYDGPLSASIDSLTIEVIAVGRVSGMRLIRGPPPAESANGAVASDTTIVESIAGAAIFGRGMGRSVSDTIDLDTTVGGSANGLAEADVDIEAPARAPGSLDSGIFARDEGAVDLDTIVEGATGGAATVDSDIAG